MKNLLQVIKNHKFPSFLFILVIILIVISFLVPEESNDKQKHTSQKVTFKNILPGTSSKQSVEDQLGQSIAVENKDNQDLFQYKSNSQNRNHIVTYNENGTVKLLKEIVTSQDNSEINANKIKASYGKTQNIYYQDKTDGIPSIYLYIYPDKGLAYLGNPQSNIVIEVWYFVPTDINSFLNSFASEYKKAPSDWTN